MIRRPSRSRTTRAALAGLLAAAAVLAPAASAPATTTAAYDPAIGTATQLFLDDYRTASATNVGRVVHPARKDGVVLGPDRPWESNNAYVYGTAIHDAKAGLFKLWYQAYDRTTSTYFMCYATSRDGRHWRKPDLGVHDYGGSTANNIVGDMHSATVVKDDRDPDPARRYKMLGMSYGSGYAVWFSPDGVRWTPSPANPVLPDGDVANVTYDPATKRFLAVTKHPDGGRRTAFLSTSTDFVHWSAPQVTLRADQRDQDEAVARGFENAQVYGMPILPYKGAYVGLPWIFSYGGAGAPGTYGDGPVETQLAFSRDLTEWNRDDRAVVIPRGAAGAFDSGMTFTAGDVIVRGGRIWLYYGGWDGLHGSTTRGASIGLASWREDGFVSEHAAGAGVLTTKPLVFRGDRLRVNADFTAPGARLRVEVLGADGRPVPGLGTSAPVTGDRLDAVVRWPHGADLGRLAGRQVRLRFHVTRGDLYAYRFTGPDR
ncbi:MAG TPA: hypothetical protein VGL93_27590 [Streptosporangiaceae bacterium]|jgi:hypothetical protein